MYLKPKFLCTLLGAGIMLVGTIIGTTVSPLTAQNSHFGDIACKSLTVYDGDDHKVVSLGSAKIIRDKSTFTTRAYPYYVWESTTRKNGVGRIELLDSSGVIRITLAVEDYPDLLSLIAVMKSVNTMAVGISSDGIYDFSDD